MVAGICYAAAQHLADIGADAVKVGIGPGSICTTRVIKAWLPQLSAITEVYNAIGGSDIPIIADGGIRYTGDIPKALPEQTQLCWIPLAGTSLQRNSNF